MGSSNGYTIMMISEYSLYAQSTISIPFANDIVGDPATHDLPIGAY